MATGYTYPVKNGEVTALGEFIKRYAIGCLRDRDEFPRQLETSDWGARRLADAENDLAKIEAQTDEEIERDAEESYQRQLRDSTASNEKNRIEQERYAAMIAKAQAWDAPEILQPLKENMIKHLIESKKHDDFTWEPPRRLSVAEWRDLFIESAKRQIENAKKEVAEENERNATNAAWIKAVWEAIENQH